MLRLSRVTVAALVAPMIMLVGCATTGSAEPSGGALSVVTTTTVFADIVANVAGDQIEVSSIIPAGVGPEDYEARPSDAQKLVGADLVVSNGVGLDDFLDRLLETAGGEHKRLVLGDGIEPIVVDDEPNPHFWLDPSIVRDHYLPAIVTALSNLDPSRGSTYQANAERYAGQLDELDSELMDEVEGVPPGNRKLVTFHDAFPYFARHFGFELVGVILPNVGQEPSAAQLAELVNTVQAAGVRAVFSEAQFSPRLAQTLADEAGVTQVVTTLYNDALGDPPADTYLGMMRWNMEHIVEALK